MKTSDTWAAARPITPPPGGSLASTYANADLVDAYAVQLPETASADLTVLARAILANPPRSVRPLMFLRDRIMGAVGVKTSGQIRRAGAGRRDGVIGSFPVQSQTVTEIVMGEDDRHLDFRTSMMLSRVDGRRELSWTTVVHCRNRLGRTYLAAITPFHRAIVPAYLDRAARAGWPTAL
ncbi:MAG: DUF2867 domain-containing protein [Sphingosinicella sp.]|nr:DUF2867 domain-containing protein [Sphingosinicella sp.]